MDDFVIATAVERVDDNCWTATLAEDWALWGPAGGYLTSLVLRAAGAATAFTRPVSLSCQFLRVAKFQPVEILVESLRAGRRSEALQVQLKQEGKLILNAVVWVTLDGESGMEHDYAPIRQIPDPESLASYATLYPDRSQHPFMARIERRPIDPIAADDLTPREPELVGLYKFQPRALADEIFADAARVMLLLDTYAWLATYSAHPVAGPSPWIAPNLDYYYRFHRPTVAAPWLYMRNRADIAQGSLISTDGEIRSLDGVLLASGSAQLLCSPRPQQFR